MKRQSKFKAWRLYYRSMRLIYQAFESPHRAWWFPFFGRGEFRPRGGGRPVVIPSRYWMMLPTASRLVMIDAPPEWRDDKLFVTFRQYSLVAPPMEKSVPISLKEIFIDDVYQLEDRDFTGMTVLDVGANIGDSSIAFAGKGARVHAFEPLPMLQSFLRSNVNRNGMEQSITIHPVGLSTKNEQIEITVSKSGSVNTDTHASEAMPGYYKHGVKQQIQLVKAAEYLSAQGVTTVDVLKLDCEGCEYALFTDNGLLDAIRPRRIIMEYHRGGDGLYVFLQRHGYTVAWPEREKAVGYMYAVYHSN